MANDKKALLPLIVALVASLLCFCSPLPAFADDAVDDSPAYEVWQQYQDSSVTEFNLYKQVAEDLAYKWFYADATKRAKVPLQSKALGSYKQLSQYAEEYETPDEQWQAFYDDFHPSFMVRMYSLVTYEDSMSTWSVSDSYAYQHFKEWYEWFNISSPGGETEESGLAGEYYVYPVDHIVNQTAYDNLGAERCEWVAFSKNVIDEQLSHNPDFYFSYMYGGNYSTTNKSWYLATTTRPLVYVGDPNKYDFTSGSMMYAYGYTGTITKEYVRDTQLGQGVIVEIRNFQGGHRNYVTENWTIREPTYSYDTVAYFTGRMDSGELIVYDPSNEDPVYPVYPEPDTPDLPTPNNPIYVDNDNTTTTVDLTPILDALRAINTNIMSGFTAIEADFAAFAEYLGEWQETLWQELRSVNAWIERIFYKTGGGSTDGPDITIDGDGWWSWLSNIAGLLLGDLAGAVTGLAGAFDVLRGLFPFSVPWDLAALLGLFVSDPVTPVFELPVPFGYVNGTLQSASVHVDLSAWDNVMVAVRSVELAIFALGLALKTRELLKNAEVEQ